MKNRLLFNSLLLILLPFASKGCIDSWFSKYRLQAYALNSTHFRFIAQIPLNNYFSVGFGSNMRDVDMILWQAYSSNP
jgi:hypothetical protein